MKVFYISPIGKETPQLFDTFTFDKTENIKEATVVFFDCYSDLGEYDFNTLDCVRGYKKPVVAFQEKDFGGMSKEVWNGFDLFDGCKVVYFMRKMDKTKPYFDWIYPYEKIIQNEFEQSNTIHERPIDICFIGNTSPQRESVCNELSKHFKCDFVLGQPRIEHGEWLNRHRQSKFFLTADGGGFSDERPYQLYSIGPMIKQKNNHLQSHPFKANTQCIEIEEKPTEANIKTIQLVLNNPDLLYSIYTEGILHMNNFYTSNFRNQYILEILSANGIN